MADPSSGSAVVDVLKAVADQIRWQIVTQMAGCDELPCTTLEHTLPISKSTISYHIKILYEAGLVDIRREGKFYFYRLRRHVLDSVLQEVRAGIDGLPDATLLPEASTSTS
jgi:DNA-binding transcriptional ArsR family regulator